MIHINPNEQQIVRKVFLLKVLLQASSEKRDHANWEYSIKCKIFFFCHKFYQEIIVHCSIGSIKNCHHSSLRLHQTQERVSEVKLSQDCEEKFKVLEKWWYTREEGGNYTQVSSSVSIEICPLGTIEILHKSKN